MEGDSSSKSNTDYSHIEGNVSIGCGKKFGEQRSSVLTKFFSSIQHT